MQALKLEEDKRNNILEKLQYKNKTLDQIKAMQQEEKMRKVWIIIIENLFIIIKVMSRQRSCA